MPNTLTPASNPQTRWASYDAESKVMKDTSGKEIVDHGASAKANLKEIGQNVKDVFAANHFANLEKTANDSDILAFGVILLGAPYAAMAEVGDVLGAPFKVAKNATDAAAHGAAAAADKLVFWK